VTKKGGGQTIHFLLCHTQLNFCFTRK
jgi:hypothetical protein